MTAACSAYTIIGTAMLSFVAGIVAMAFMAAMRDTGREEQFRAKMRERYGNDGKHRGAQ